MAIEKWIGGTLGTGLTWTDAFSTATLNWIANGNAILSDISFTNGSNLDVLADLSISLASIAGAAPNFVGVGLYPLNQDGTTYGDGRFVTSGTGPAPNNYMIGAIGVV